MIWVILQGAPLEASEASPGGSSCCWRADPALCSLYYSYSYYYYYYYFHHYCWEHVLVSSAVQKCIEGKTPIPAV